MTTHRAKHLGNYTVIRNEPLEDRRLSWKARGLLVYLLSKPDDWRVIVTHLVSQSDLDGRAAVTTALEELEQLSYLKRTGLRTDVGKFGGVDYEIYETPDHAVSENQPRHRVRLSDRGKSHTTKYLKEPSTDLTNTEENSQIVDMAKVRERNKTIKAALRRNDPSVTMKVPRK